MRLLARFDLQRRALRNVEASLALIAGHRGRAHAFEPELQGESGYEAHPRATRPPAAPVPHGLLQHHWP